MQRSESAIVLYPSGRGASWTSGEHVHWNGATYDMTGIYGNHFAVYRGRLYLQFADPVQQADGRVFGLAPIPQVLDHHPIQTRRQPHHAAGLHTRRQSSLHHHASSHLQAGTSSRGGPALPTIKTRAADDPWQGNEFARQLFQGDGARYFVGANHLVERTTEIAAAGYTAAFFAPELLASAAPVLRFTLRPGVTLVSRLYGTYLATAAGSSIAVLGRFPEYLDDAEMMGANVFSMSMRTYNFLDWFEATWAGNQAFIDRVVQTGQRVYLATPPIGQDGSIYERELLYLRSIGASPYSWYMVPR